VTISRRDLLKAGAAGALGGSLLPLLGSSVGRAQAIPKKAKRIVYLFMAGGPSQLELFDPKPGLTALRNTEMPKSVLGDKRITTMTAGQSSLRVASALVNFEQHGQSGMWASELVPHLAGKADDLCLLRTVYGDAINHDPATNLALTGSQLQGMPSLGSWVSYALGIANPNLPSFVTMASQTKVAFVQPLGKRLWSSSFLPAIHQGVALRPGDQPVLYLDDDSGLDLSRRNELFDAVVAMNKEHFDQVGDPEIAQRNDAYAVAREMQESIRELADLSLEPDEVFDLYGPESRTPGTFAANCLRARRLLERDVRVVCLMHRGWDNHYTLTAEMRACCADTDQPAAALLEDLKRTGLLEDTLFVWGGEFGRTAYSQGDITDEDHGRDHHAYASSVLLAGGGIKPGITYGETDDFSYNIVKDPVHVHDLHATLLWLIGKDHTELTYRHDGRDHRLTDLGGRVIEEILA
jgi:hypothetical protein